MRADQAPDAGPDRADLRRLDLDHRYSRPEGAAAQGPEDRGQERQPRGDHDRAIADYDAVLKLQPRRAWALYGRGLARQRKGLKAEGDADIAAAVAIDKALPARWKALGVTP